MELYVRVFVALAVLVVVVVVEQKKRGSDQIGQKNKELCAQCPGHNWIQARLKVTLFCEIVYWIFIACEKALLGLSGRKGVGKGKGKESLHLRLLNLNICIPEWDAKCWLARSLGSWIGWFLITLWRNVPLSELTRKITGQTPSLAWNLWKTIFILL